MLSHSFTGLDFHFLQALSKNILIIKVIAIVKLWNYNCLQVIILSNVTATSMFNQFHIFQVRDIFLQYSGKLVAVTGKFSKSLVWCRLLRTCSSEDDQIKTSCLEQNHTEKCEEYHW